jgi:hypothetical protein
MFYTHRDCLLTLNGAAILANQVSLFQQASLTPSYIANDANIQNYVPAGGREGNLKLNYYLTGKDPLKDYLWFESGCVTGNFAGLQFNSGYLRAYSLSAIPNSPLAVQAEIVFYDRLTGVFAPASQSVSNLKLLNLSDVQLNGKNLGDLATITKFNYSVSNNVSAAYEVDSSQTIDSLHPSRIVFGERQSLLELSINNLDPDLSISGKGVELFVNFNDSSGIIRDSIIVKGALVSKEVSVGANDLLNVNFVVNQKNPLNEPEITGISPGTIGRLGKVNVFGYNFTRTARMFLGDKNVFLTFVSANQVMGKMPIRVTGGFLRIVTEGGESTSPQLLTVNGGGLGAF